MTSIPNLNTLRSGRRGPRRRGGGRGVSGYDLNDQDGATITAGQDRVIQETDHDASSSRMSAVALGYLQDPYAKTFFPSQVDVPKRYPIINRGTYVRTTAIDRLIVTFLQSHVGQRKQIISLGAGSDTRFFRLCANAGVEQAPVDYHELDLPSNVDHKRASLRQSEQFDNLIRAAESRGSRYHLHAVDLRDLTNKSPPVIPHFDSDIATLLLSECCLCYLPPESATSVLQYFAMNVKASLALILYEPIRPFDAFGKTMVANLSSRGIHLQTLQRYSSLEAQRQRLSFVGLADGQGARDVSQLWNDDGWVVSEERERIEKLEWLDEVEEWHLLASHYCVAWGWRGEAFDEAWSGIDGSRTQSEIVDR